MLNVALNIWKKGENVLYVPLEMPAEEIRQKAVSRETEIPFNLIEHADKLNDTQIKMIAEKLDEWTGPAHRFQILDMNGRSKLSQVRREIEKKIMAGFQPRVVVIDYADNLTPDKRQTRSDLEMNDILEDMRQMGKQLGFAVITAAQLARDGLKRVREQKDGKQQLGSTDIRGGQVMMANSDTVYAQLRNPAQPADQLLFFCLKARHGKNIFKSGQDRTILSVKADIGLIESANDVVYEGPQDEDLLDGMLNSPSIGIEEDDDQPF
jgi:replicative DNA helicase